MDAKKLSAEELAAHIPWLERLAVRLVGDPGLAADLVQETWIDATGSGPAEGSLRGWLSGILRHRMLRERRRARRRVLREHAAARKESLEADETLERAHAARLLMDRLVAQRDPYREVLLAHFFEGQSVTEIAQAKGVANSTVRSHLRRGLRLLREDLEREGRGRDLVFLLAPLAQPEKAAGVLGLGGVAGLIAAVAIGAIGAIGWLSAPEVRVNSTVTQPVDSVRAPAEVGTGAPIDSLREASRRVALGAAPPPREHFVRGQLVNEQGQAIAGARVLFEHSARRHPPTALDGITTRQHTGREQRVKVEERRTDAEGRFEIPAPKVSGFAALSFRAPGLAPLDLNPLPLSADRNRELGILRMESGGVFAGRVVDFAGKPVSGALIARVIRMDNTFFAPDELVPMPVSDATGKFRTDEMPLGAQELLIHAEGHPALLLKENLSRDPNQTHELVLPKPLKLRGRVVSSPGTDLTAVHVSVKHKELDSLHQDLARCNAEGHFEWVGPASLDITGFTLKPVTLRKGIQRSIGPDLSLEIGSLLHDIELRTHPRRRVRFSLQDRLARESEPLEHAEILLASSRGTYDHSSSLESNAPGHYVIEDFFRIDNPWCLVIRHAGFAEELIPPGAFERETTDLGTLLLERETTVLVRVVDSLGAPVEGATVVRRSPEAPSKRSLFIEPRRATFHAASSEAQTDERGEVRIAYLPDERNQVYAVCAGHAPSKRREFRVLEEDAVLELALGAAGELAVQVIDSKGRPRAQCAVNCRQADFHLAAEMRVEGKKLDLLAVTDSEGRVLFTGLAEGPAHIQVADALQAVDIPRGGRAHATFETPSFAPYSVRLRLNGTPLAGAKVWLRKGWYNFSPVLAVRSDSEGQLEFSAVEVGPGWLMIQHEELALTQFPEIQIEEDAGRVALDLYSAKLRGRVEQPGAVVCVYANDAVGLGGQLSNDRPIEPIDHRRLVLSTEPDGSFEIEGLPAAAEVLVLARTEAGEVGGANVTLDPGELRERLVIETHPTASVRISLEPKPRLSQGLRLSALDPVPVGFDEHFSRIGSRSTVVFPRVVPGSWRIEFVQQGRRHGRVVEIGAESETVIDLTGVPLE